MTTSPPTGREIRQFCYPGLHGREAWADLTLYDLADGGTLVVASERPDNPGASVTNAAEQLATWAAFRLEFEPEQLVWVEHYPAVGYGQIARRAGQQARRNEGTVHETYDLVTFELHRGAWRDAGVLWPPVPWRLARPEWRPTREDDWRHLGWPAAPALARTPRPAPYPPTGGAL